MQTLMLLKDEKGSNQVLMMENKEFMKKGTEKARYVNQ
jgi:hypothetical protein